MKALTLTQPYASLVAWGDKKIETRSWSTQYRGELAIHAARTFPAMARKLCDREPFRSVLGCSPEELPLGAILAICRLTECFPITPDNLPPEPELSFGIYSPGRYAWVLEDVHMLPRPVLARGRLGLWEWDDGELPLNDEIASPKNGSQ
jgi:hypothetical protein